MKKFKAIFLMSLSLATGVTMISSCGGQKPEDEVRSYSRYFIEKLSANQIDSILSSYPDIVKADSIIPIQSDTIIVVKTADGDFNATLMDGVILKINRSEDGKLSVKESMGLFAFPNDKLMIAKGTGMVTDSLSDIEIQEKLADEDYFKYIQKEINEKKNNILKINGGTVTNNTDKTIDGSEYTVTKAFYVRGNYFSRGGTSYSSIKGKTLQPGESMKVSLVQALMGMEYLSGIKWNIPDDEVLAKYSPLTGKEYQEYLDSKK